MCNKKKETYINFKLEDFLTKKQLEKFNELKKMKLQELNSDRKYGYRLTRISSRKLSQIIISEYLDNK